MRFENTFFIIGTAYAGKSTMVKLLAEKYGGIACEENYHNALLPELDKNEFPNLTMNMKRGSKAPHKSARPLNCRS